jgi:hypothetical protein
MKERVKLSDLRPGPIRHAALSHRLIERIKAVKLILADVDEMPLEKTIENFKRDINPEAELVVWERIANTFRAFVSSHPDANLMIKKDAFVVLVGASMGIEEWSIIKHLTDDEIKQLVLRYHESTRARRST